MIGPDDERHGTTRGYHAGCRQPCCRRAINRYEKGGKARRYRGETWQIPALGTQRRIRALMRLGWTSTDIATACGWQHRNYVRRLLTGQKGKPCRWIERKTYRTIAETYEQLAMTIPPHAPHRARTRTNAIRHGWPPPLSWDDIDNDPAPTGHRTRHSDRDYDTNHLIDEATIIRILDGETLPANRAERIETMRRWLALGRSERSLCERMGWRDSRYTPKSQEGAA